MDSSNPELQYLIALTMVPAIGPITARKLIGRFGSASEIFKQKREQLQRIQGIGPRLSSSINSSRLMEMSEKELRFLERFKINAFYYEEPDFPHRLNQCPDGPVLLYSIGGKGLHCRRSLAVVGTRKATTYGKDRCREIIAGLSASVKDLVIVSGLAYGIDVCAHRAALKEGILTVAVLGHGMSTLYPWSHREVARQIRMQGALVSDFHSQMGPERNNFLRRNRIIAGLADATLVVESAESGGALITAHMAASYNRDVLAIPGRSIDLRSSGCNRLIGQNLAALVESPEDIIHHLNWAEPEGRSISVNQFPRQKKTDPSGEEKKILISIKNEPGIDQDSIVQQTGLPVQVVLSLLMEMELKDWISIEPGNRYSPGINFRT